MSKNKIYWRGSEELEKSPVFVAKAEKEFSEELPIDQFLGTKDLDSSNTSRRDFLKYMGFGITAATLAACETPVIKSMPYVVKPNDVMPGIANYYASTYFDGNDYASILVKTREGRPIFIEGNKKSPVTKGAVNARVNSSILSLYSKKRFQQPMKDGQPSDWATVDSEIGSELQKIKAAGGTVGILSSTMISPSSKAIISDLKSWMGEGSVMHASHDAISASGMMEANKRMFGKSMIPSYSFDKAKVIVSFGADFLTNWINPTEFSADYAVMRKPNGGSMSKHYQIETVMTTTGSNADVRGAVRPSELGVAVKALYNAVASKTGGAAVGSAAVSDDDNNVADKIANAAADLAKHKGAALVVSGSNDPNVQLLVNGINQMLGNYGKTISTDRPLHLRQGSEEQVATLVNSMKSGSIGALFVVDSDPAYSLPSSMNFGSALGKVATTVSFATKPDETSILCKYVCPTHHFLESWNDANPEGDDVSFAQPTIKNIYDTRQWQDSMLSWMGKSETYYDYLKAKWNSPATASDDPDVIFASRWNTFVQSGLGKMSAMGMSMAASASNSNGVVADAVEKKKAILDQVFEEVEDALTGGESSEAGSTGTTSSTPMSGSAAIVAAANAIGSGESSMEVAFYAKTSMGAGNDADNPWLQELPDPVTKVVWDQYIAMNPSDMKDQGLNVLMGEQERAGMGRITVGDQSLELPVVSMPGQKKGTVGIALGYGKGFEGERQIGTNVFPMLPVVDGFIQYNAPATFEKMEMRYNIASTQTQHTMMGRKILNETSLSDYKSSDRSHWNPIHKVADSYGKKQPVDKLDLWAEHDIDLGHRWGLSIDLNTCIGCNACVTACHAENNVPVVGKDEVNRTRTMSWIRIDRYFSSDADPEIHGGLNQEKNYGAMEIASDYPEVGFMPVMCQHCNHAPCETVCPVAATTHSNEGYNQMTYNRCIGTRYCANNCPYKVRRFNWFNYVADRKFTDVNPAQDDLARMVLNPDVVVRSRGVMEKCSLCVQRIQAGKLDAKKKGQPVQDGEVQTACSSACPTNAIAFGDINDQNSNVRKEAMDDRAYHLLEEVGVKPNVWYQTKVRNADEAQAHA